MVKKYNLEEIEKSLKVNPQESELWYQKGMALGELGRVEECLPAFSRGLAIAPFDPDLRLQRGRKYTSIDDYVTAISDLTLATRLNIEHWENWYYLGVACFLDGNFEAAKEYHGITIKLKQKYDLPGIASAVVWYWQSCMKLGDIDEAEKILELVNENSKIGINMNYLERALLHKGERDPNIIEKEEYYKDTDRPGQYRMTVLFSIAMHYYYKGDIEKSNEYLRKVYEFPDHLNYHQTFVYKQTLQEMKARGLLAND